jgi:hypothetical protein
MQILPRTANLELSSSSGAAGLPADQEEALDIPKKTQLAVEMMEREKTQGPDMHRWAGGGPRALHTGCWARHPQAAAPW